MVAQVDYRALAELRHQVRVFLSWSERQARAAGIEPRQHQVLLAIKGLPPELRPSLATLAERLQVRHHSMVELVDRLEVAGFVKRKHSPTDAREILVRIAPQGERILRRLSLAHAAELQTVGPALARALEQLTTSHRISRSTRRKRG